MAVVVSKIPRLGLRMKPHEAASPSIAATGTREGTSQHGGMNMAARKPASAKRIQAKKRKRAQRLSRRAEQGYFGPASFVVEPAGLEKMSELLERFVEPFLSKSKTRDEYRELLAIGAVAWNVALFPKESRLAELDDAARQLRFSKADQPEFLGLLQELMDRKDRYFSTIKRAIVSYEVIDTPDGFNLFVISTPLGSRGL
jgi:hypothetical protein